VTLTREEAFLCLSVSDNGKGLSTEEIGHVFDPFWRANSNVVGLGVGLSIVAALVKAHAGTIEVTSAGPDAGATFMVRIPIDAAPSGRYSIRDKPGVESAQT
jgi:signal transduction histidine kinase